MKKNSLLPVLLSAELALVPIQASQAALLLYYSFDDETLGASADGELITNGGSLLTAGVLDTGTDGGNVVNFLASGVPGPSGVAIQLTPANDGLGGLAAPNINTGFTVASLSIMPTTGYTIMAWANFASGVGDNMIFGGNPAQVGTD